MKSCVYLHKRLDDSQVFYIGHGSISRSKSKDGRNKLWNKIVREAGGFEIEYLLLNISKSEAKQIENNFLDKPKPEWNLINIKGSENVKEIDYDLGNEYFQYDETSPTCLIWKKVHQKDRHSEIGKPAGSKQSRGCFKVRLFKKDYLVHRIIYLLFNGKLDASKVIDHVDGNPANNRIENLREVSHSKNSLNRKNNQNKSGVEGVCKIKVRNTEYWVATWYENCERKNKYFSIPKLGDYLAFEKACLERKERLHGPKT